MDNAMKQADCLAGNAQHSESGGSALRRVLRVGVWHPLLNFTRPIRHRLGLRQTNVKDWRDWIDREFAAPSTDLVKQKVLLRNGLRDAIWVETGTFMGDTTDLLSSVAKIVFSVEPEPALFSK